MVVESKILLNGTESAEFVGIDKSTWAALKADGKLPQSVCLRKREYWTRETLTQWLNTLQKEQSNENANQHTGAVE